MNRSPYTPRSRRWSVAGGVLLASILATSTPAQDAASPPLARYVPAEGLAVLIEHDGLDARPDAWNKTATARMLTETPLGAMLETIAAQVLDRVLVGIPDRPASGKDVVQIGKHLVRRGFVVGYCGSLNPPQPRAVVVVIRGAADNAAFKNLIAQIKPLNEPAATKVEQPNGRTVWVLEGVPVRWWYEKEDAVFSFAPPDGPDPVADTLDGKSPGAVNHPARAALAQAEPGEVPVGRLFVDLAALPPLPKEAKDLGLDAIKRVDARWSIRGKAVSATLAIQAPRPRRGFLALFDQPPIAPGTKLNLPEGQTNLTLLAVDPIRTAEVILALIKRNDPDSIAKLAEVAARFQRQSGLSLRDDLVGKIGPRVAIASPGGGSAFGMLGMWFTPPDFGTVAELKDPAGFATNLDRLMDWANRELKALGAIVPAPPGGPVSSTFAEFRRLKGPERGYVLAVPPAVLPTPAGLRPTVIVDTTRGLLALGGSPTAARRALGSLVLTGPVAATDRPGEFVRVQADSAGSLPQLLASLPSLVQLVGIAAAQPNGPARRRPPGPPFRLEIDPDAIPEAAALRPYLFPTRFALAADDASIRLTLDMAFPLPIPTLNAGVEVPVLIALLLPAVQAAREAARRSQSINNMKQIGLAMHNYESANGFFPPAVVIGPDGKTPHSWRVALLPYLEQASLSNAYKFDEPWDGPTNRKLIDRMPAIFRDPSDAGSPPSSPSYFVLTGPDTLFPARATGTTIAEVTDGVSNTILVVEAKRNTPWTKPDDIPFERGGAIPAFGGSHPGGFCTLMADGSVRFLKQTINQVVLRALATRAGGEIISSDAF